MKRFFQLLFAPCEGITGLVSQSLDRDLTRAERFAVRTHMLYCSACRRFRKQIQQIRESLTLSDETITETGELKLSKNTRDRFVNSLKQ